MAWWHGGFLQFPPVTIATTLLEVFELVWCSRES